MANLAFGFVSSKRIWFWITLVLVTLPYVLLSNTRALAQSFSSGNLRSVSSIDCFGRPGSGNFGTVIIAQSDNTVTVEVTLSGGLPNTTFSVELWEAGEGCFPDDNGDTGARLNTDSAGNGSVTVNLTLPFSSLGGHTLGDGMGTEQIVIALDLFSSQGGDTYATEPISLPNNSDTNRPPFVDAGPNQVEGHSNTNIVLPGIATDDGLPIPSLFATAWVVVSGPGQVTFTNSAVPTTLASFDKLGTYTLRLIATDGEFTVQDDIVVKVIDHYRVELKAWIPKATIVDPLMITGFEFPNLLIPFLQGTLRDCFIIATNGNILNGSTRVVESKFFGDSHREYGEVNSDYSDYRAITWVEFDFDGDSISNFEYMGAYGHTTRRITIVNSSGNSVSCRQTAQEDISNLRPNTLTGNNTFNMQIFGANPLMPREGTQFPEMEILCAALGKPKESAACRRFARNIFFEPALDGEVNATIDANGDLAFSYVTDLSPNYGIAVQRNSTTVMNSVIYDVSCFETDGYIGAVSVLLLLQTVNNPIRNIGNITATSPNVECSFPGSLLAGGTARRLSVFLFALINPLTEPFSLVLASLLPRESQQLTAQTETLEAANILALSEQEESTSYDLEEEDSRVFLPIMMR